MRQRHVRGGLACLKGALIAAAVIPSGARAADGDLDPAFGSGGITLMGPVGESSPGAPRPAVQPDGKVVFCTPLLAGGSGLDFFITRLDADGSFDTTFNFDGKVTVDFDGGADECVNVAIQADGKIVAVGISRGTGTGSTADFAVVRLDADGSLDPTFGGGTGKTTIAFDLGGDNDDQALSVALQPDGKIVVAGSANAGANGYVFAVARLLTDGSRDTGFNASGRVTIPFGTPSAPLDATAFSVAIDNAGRIILGGDAGNAQSSNDFALARLLPDGALDGTLDADGRVTIAFDIGATRNDSAIQTIVRRDGKIVMAGYADAGSGSTSNMDFAVARLQEDGSPDPAFGVGGKVVVPIDVGGSQNDIGTGVVEDEAGRLVIVGSSALAASTQGVTAVRLRSDGTLDPAFGILGKKIVGIEGTFALTSGVALQGTQLIVGGQLTSGSDFDDFLARLQVDLLFADGFE